MIVATYARTASWRAPHFGLRSRLFIPCVVTSDSETGELRSFASAKSAFAYGAAAPQLLHPARPAGARIQRLREASFGARRPTVAWSPRQGSHSPPSVGPPGLSVHRAEYVVPEASRHAEVG